MRALPIGSTQCASQALKNDATSISTIARIASVGIHIKVTARSIAAVARLEALFQELKSENNQCKLDFEQFQFQYSQYSKKH